MKKVSLRQLKHLAACTTQLFEADQKTILDRSSRLCDDCHQNFLDRIHQHEKGGSLLDSMIEDAYHDLENSWLRDNCPPVEYIGSGSSRSAYAIGGGMCMKVAHSRAGIAQNRAEFKNTSIDNQRQYSCFARSYRISTDGLVLLTECCGSYNKSLLASKYKVQGDFACAVKVLFDYFKLNNFYLDGVVESLESRRLQLRKGTCIIEIVDDSIALAKQMRAAQTAPDPLREFLLELLQFYVDNGRDDAQMDIDDIYSDNIGLVLRSGKIVPAILDSGMSIEVADKYYDDDD